MAGQPQFPPDSGYAGTRDLYAGGSDYNGVSFVVKQILNRCATATLVRVVAVTNTGGVAAVGYVDVQPLVNQVDGAGNATPHGIVHHLPYVRLQGGANAVILDPVVGDEGVAVFCDHDISVVKATGQQANPGSRRRFDMADGVYFGGCLNASPTQYVAFEAGGIALVSPTAVLIQAPVIGLSGTVAITGAFSNNGVNIGSTHEHAGVQTGSGNTGVPH